MKPGLSYGELAAMFVDIDGALSTSDEPDVVLVRVTGLAKSMVPGAEYAGLSVGRPNGRFTTVAPTDEIVTRVDQIQHGLGHGPCVDAIEDGALYNAPDLGTDPRWPDFGQRAVEAEGIRSMLSLRLHIEDDSDLIAGLNMYSHSTQAFDDESETVALLIATHGALAVGRVYANRKAENARLSMKTNRDIGVAMGILMNASKITRDQAFDLLRVVSQHTHRKISDIAAEVAETGLLPTLPNTRRGRPTDV